MQGQLSSSYEETGVSCHHEELGDWWWVIWRLFRHLTSFSEANMTQTLIAIVLTWFSTQRTCSSQACKAQRHPRWYTSLSTTISDCRLPTIWLILCLTIWSLMTSLNLEPLENAWETLQKTGIEKHLRVQILFLTSLHRQALHPLRHPQQVAPHLGIQPQILQNRTALDPGWELIFWINVSCWWEHCSCLGSDYQLKRGFGAWCDCVLSLDRA